MEYCKLKKQMCFLMKNGKCEHPTGCMEITDKCEGCTKIIEVEGKKYCKAYPNPELKWRFGWCNHTSLERSEGKGRKKKFVNPLKASKQSHR